MAAGNGGAIDNADQNPGAVTVTVADSTFSGDSGGGGEIDTGDGGQGVLVVSASTFDAGSGSDIVAGHDTAQFADAFPFFDQRRIGPGGGNREEGLQMHALGIGETRFDLADLVHGAGMDAKRERQPSPEPVVPRHAAADTSSN